MANPRNRATTLGVVATIALLSFTRFGMSEVLAADGDPGSALIPSGDAAVGGSGANDPLATVVVTARRLNAARSEIETQTGASTYTITSDAIAATPGGENVQLNQVLLQAPDVVQDSFGQLHVRADHNDLQYRLNGVILPEGISVFSQTLSPRLISSLSLITGALPAEYGPPALSTSPPTAACCSQAEKLRSMGGAMGLSSPRRSTAAARAISATT
jgi:hypothetical protein